MKFSKESGKVIDIGTLKKRKLDIWTSSHVLREEEKATACQEYKMRIMILKLNKFAEIVQIPVLVSVLPCAISPGIWKQT